ncbi:MAG: hypothetical protein ACYDBQ_05380 [Thermoplasmatota archaeon]
MEGEFVHLRLYDVGAELDLARITTVRGKPAELAPLVSRSPAPPYATFPSPREVRLEVAGSTLEIRLHATGVVALRLRTRFRAGTLDTLRSAAREVAVAGVKATPFMDHEYQAVLEDVRDSLMRPYVVQVEPEGYLAYCITEGGPVLDQSDQGVRESLAALVAGERPRVLAAEVVASALKHTIRYYANDAVILGWDEAVILGHRDGYEDVLDIMELANLELLEFRTYDSYLDQRLEESFASLQRLWAPGGLFRSARTALHDISQIRVEVARLTDNLHDTGKMFGDWYMAKIHQHMHDRFHVGSWERAVAAKMQTLEGLFHLAEEEANHRRSLTLEVLVLLLFVLDVAVIFWHR